METYTDTVWQGVSRRLAPLGLRETQAQWPPYDVNLSDRAAIVFIEERHRRRVSGDSMSGVHEKIISAAELVGLTLPEPRRAVPGLFPEGFNLLVGKLKMGKSWLSLSIALAVANGGEVFEKIKVEAGEVFYLALEDNQRRLQDRLKKILGEDPAPVGLHLVTEWPRLKSGGLEPLETWLSEHPHCRLILIDTLTRIRPPRIRGADLYEEDGTLGSMLQALGHKHHLAVVAVHHTRKAKASDIMDTVLGSTGLTGAADSIAVLMPMSPKLRFKFLVRISSIM